jgi:hypothetical protein
MMLVGMPMRRAFGRGANGQTRDGCRERERESIRRIHRPSHDTIDTQFLHLGSPSHHQYTWDAQSVDRELRFHGIVSNHSTQS